MLYRSPFYTIRNILRHSLFVFQNSYICTFFLHFKLSFIHFRQTTQTYSGCIHPRLVETLNSHAIFFYSNLKHSCFFHVSLILETQLLAMNIHIKWHAKVFEHLSQSIMCVIQNSLNVIMLVKFQTNLKMYIEITRQYEHWIKLIKN